MQKALEKDESDADSHALLGSVYLLMRQFEKAIAAGERSVELLPNGAMQYGVLGITLSYTGRLDEAIDHLKQGIRLNSFPEYWYFLQLASCYSIKGQYEEALTECKKALYRSPYALFVHLQLAAIYVRLDRQDDARSAVKKVLEIDPNFSVERASKAWPYKNLADAESAVEVLRKAGLK